MKNLTWVAVGLVLLSVVLVFWNYYYLSTVKVEKVIVEVNNPIVEPSIAETDETFVGTLEEVNVGCFADGECYVVISGKHVTALRGWSNETVGQIVGVEGFGELENYVGSEVEVHARRQAAGTYTLYGKESYYIKYLEVEVEESKEVSVSIGIGATSTLSGVTISPHDILEDSRCPADVMCIQAGTVRVRTTLSLEEKSEERTFVLGVPLNFNEYTITLVEVKPVPNTTVKIVLSGYVFTFVIEEKGSTIKGDLIETL